MRVALLWLAAALISGFTARRYLGPLDEGVLMQAAARMGSGEWPWRDFSWSYGPGQPLFVLAFGDSLWTWHNDFIWGRGKRRDGMIILQNDDHIPIKIWIFHRGLPTKYVGPSLNAKESQVAIEELEITHEGLALVSPGTIAASALGTIGL